MADLDSLLAFAFIVTLIVTSPGPNLFLLLRTVPTFGRFAGLANTLGFATAILTHATLSFIGVGAILATSATAFTFLKITGAGYLFWLGLKALRSAIAGPRTISTPDPDPATEGLAPRHLKRFAEGFLTNILNPKPTLFYLAAFPQFLAVGGAPLWSQALLLAWVHAAIALAWYGFVVLTLSQFVGWLRRPRLWQAIQGLTGVALTLLAVRLLLFRQSP
ncbi:LysE family translocator [Sulfitobacter sp. D35]|uniref:LysE family translocator n=1 Tax=Sulfitobacter sp. D35 TaxID=3083252 RepID=UPI00296FC5CC|nr:LysE family translocator [Sulfitobacter sp. D35]MDW4500260.1 LysE family translocator [Sulfitobacter sp. D35]